SRPLLPRHPPRSGCRVTRAPRGRRGHLVERIMVKFALASQKRIREDIYEALSNSNARRFDGGPNYQKCLVIETCVVGEEHSGKLGSFFPFEAKIPRTAFNNLGLTRQWNTDSREEAARFLRELADLIEEPR